MLFFAARAVRPPAIQNSTLVELTDRNNLDDQLFGQFQRCADILGQTVAAPYGAAHPVDEDRSIIGACPLASMMALSSTVLKGSRPTGRQLKGRSATRATCVLRFARDVPNHGLSNPAPLSVTPTNPVGHKPCFV